MNPHDPLVIQHLLEAGKPLHEVAEIMGVNVGEVWAISQDMRRELEERQRQSVMLGIKDKLAREAAERKANRNPWKKRRPQKKRGPSVTSSS